MIILSVSLILVFPTFMKKVKLLKRRVAHLAMPLLKWSPVSATTAYRQIYGHRVWFFMPWSLATCPLKILRRPIYTRKSWVQTIRCPSFYHRSAKTSSQKFWIRILRLDLGYQISEVTLSWSSILLASNKSPVSQVFSLVCRRCHGNRIFYQSWLKIIISRRSTPSDVWKQTDTTTSLQPTTW